jgi:hypothetical protein
VPYKQSTGTENEPLDTFAARILATLAGATFPGHDEVAQQIAIARCQTLDAQGSLALLATAAPRADVARRIPVEGEVEDVDGVTIHLLLHVLDGYIDELEIYREDGADLVAPIRPDSLRVIVF